MRPASAVCGSDRSSSSPFFQSRISEASLAATIAVVKQIHALLMTDDGGIANHLRVPPGLRHIQADLLVPPDPGAAVRRFGVTKTVAFRTASDGVKHAITIRLFKNVGAPQGMLVRILEVDAGPALRPPAHAIVGLQIFDGVDR